MSPERVHHLIGLLILVISGFQLAIESGWLTGKLTRYILPGALVGVGTLIFLDPIVFHGRSFGAEGVQHQVQGILVTGLGAMEYYRLRSMKRSLLLSGAFPAVLAGQGVLFLFHSQHASGDLLLQTVQHRILGATLILAAVVKGAESFRLARGNWAAVGWLLLLFLLGIELVLYTEITLPVGSPGRHH